MSKPSTRRFVVVTSVLAAAACTAAGAEEREERPVAPFTSLVARGGVDVELTQAAAPRLVIEVDGYALEDVESEVVGEELRLSMRRTDWSAFGDRDVQVYVDFVELESITADGGSDIEGGNAFRLEALRVEASSGSDVELDIEAASLEFVLSGGSDLEIGGAAESVAIDASGGSDIEARSLAAEHVRARVSGGSDAILNASRSVTLDARGGSDVVVFGNPAERDVDNDRSSDVVWR